MFEEGPGAIEAADQRPHRRRLGRDLRGALAAGELLHPLGDLRGGRQFTGVQRGVPAHHARHHPGVGQPGLGGRALGDIDQLTAPETAHMVVHPLPRGREEPGPWRLLGQ